LSVKPPSDMSPHRKHQHYLATKTRSAIKTLAALVGAFWASGAKTAAATTLISSGWKRLRQERNFTRPARGPCAKEGWGRGLMGKYSGTSTLVSWPTQTQAEHAIRQRSKGRGKGKLCCRLEDIRYRRMHPACQELNDVRKGPVHLPERPISVRRLLN